MARDHLQRTFWTSLGLAIGLWAVGCSLNPQPLPPGPGSDNSAGTGFGEASDAGAELVSEGGTGTGVGQGVSDAATRGDAVHSKVPADASISQDGAVIDAPPSTILREAGEGGGDI